MHCESEEVKEQWQVAFWSVIDDYAKKQMSRDVHLSALGTTGLPLKNVNFWVQANAILMFNYMYVLVIDQT